MDPILQLKITNYVKDAGRAGRDCAVACELLKHSWKEDGTDTEVINTLRAMGGPGDPRAAGMTLQVMRFMIAEILGFMMASWMEEEGEKVEPEALEFADHMGRFLEPDEHIVEAIAIMKAASCRGSSSQEGLTVAVCSMCYDCFKIPMPNSGGN